MGVGRLHPLVSLQFETASEVGGNEKEYWVLATCNETG